MIIVVVNKDGRRQVFDGQSTTLEEDVTLAVASGTGFSLRSRRGAVVYGPGTVARVSFRMNDEPLTRHHGMEGT
jgi:hypothetical protein